MINSNEIVSAYGAYLRRSEDSSMAYAIEVFYSYCSGTPSRETVERTKQGLCLEVVEDFVWQGLMSLLDD